MKTEPVTYEAYQEDYAKDEDFRVVYKKQQCQHEQANLDNKFDYHLLDGVIYKMVNLCVLKEEGVS